MMHTSPWQRSAAQAAALLLAGGWVLLGHAQGVSREKAPTPGEWALLPKYCADTFLGAGPDGPRARYWEGIFGKDFWHMHHYCYAQRDLLRAGQAVATSKDRTYLYERAMYDLQYVIGVCGPNMPLMPEVLLRMGEVQLFLNNQPAASQAFAAARNLKPDYWPAYTRWIDVLMSLKLNDQAAELAREGLRHAPDIPELQERLKLAEKPVPSRAAAVHHKPASAAAERASAKP